MTLEPHHLRRLGLAWAILLALLATTTALAFAPLGRFALPVAMAIAVGKAGIVLVVFMEFARASSLVRIVAAAGAFWLGILIGLPALDYLSRTIRPVTERSLDETAIPPPGRK